MAITALTVRIDRDEYSRYWPGLETVQVTVEATGATAGDQLTWTLDRAGADAPAQTGQLIWPPGAPPRVAFTIDLRQGQDADGLNWAVQGDYTVGVTAPTGLLARSPTFAVSIVPAVELRDFWCYGVPFTAAEVFLPVQQPSRLTGVQVVRLSETHALGPIDLAYTPGPPPTLAWGGGTPQLLDPSARRTYLLRDAYDREWALVAADPALLPASPVTETLLIDKRYMDDSLLRQRVRAATAYVEAMLFLPVEPRRYCTDRLWQELGQPPRDHILPGVDYVRQLDATQWLYIHLPVRRLLRIYTLAGYFNASRVVTITPDWIAPDEVTGLVRLIPRAGALTSWQFATIPIYQFLYSYPAIGHFWQFDVACGLRRLDLPQTAPVREAIAKKAAYDLLLQAGAALKGGIAAESTARDGVSQAISYTQSAQFGMYAHLTIPWEQWLQEELPRLRQRLGGVHQVTI